jgi:hypothetical protein
MTTFPHAIFFFRGICRKDFAIRSPHIHPFLLFFFVLVVQICTKLAPRGLSSDSMDATVVLQWLAKHS